MGAPAFPLAADARGGAARERECAPPVARASRRRAARADPGLGGRRRLAFGAWAWRLGRCPAPEAVGPAGDAGGLATGCAPALPANARLAARPGLRISAGRGAHGRRVAAPG